MEEVKKYKVTLVNKEDKNDVKVVEMEGFGRGNAAIKAERDNDFKYDATDVEEV